MAWAPCLQGAGPGRGARRFFGLHRHHRGPGEHALRLPAGAMPGTAAAAARHLCIPVQWGWLLHETCATAGPTRAELRVAPLGRRSRPSSKRPARYAHARARHDCERAALRTAVPTYCSTVHQKSVPATRRGEPRARLNQTGSEYVRCRAVRPLTAQPRSRCPLLPPQVNPKGRRWNRLITAIRQPDLA